MYWLAVLLVPSLVLALRPGVSPSRRLLACALVMLVPVAGTFLAILVRRVRGGGIALEPMPEKMQRRLSTLDVSRLGEMPPILERLLSSDPSERLEALVELSSTGDAQAVAILRWTIEHGPSDVVLDAALTLEEIDLRNETRKASLLESLIKSRSVDNALAAAEAAAIPVLHRIADPAVAGSLAADARAAYEVAIELAPERTIEIEERLASLELAAGRPKVALEIIRRLMSHEGAHTERLWQLRDDAAFAARDFESLSFQPSALEIEPDVAAHRLQATLS